MSEFSALDQVANRSDFTALQVSYGGQKLTARSQWWMTLRNGITRIVRALGATHVNLILSEAEIVQNRRSIDSLLAYIQAESSELVATYVRNGLEDKPRTATTIIDRLRQQPPVSKSLVLKMKELALQGLSLQIQQENRSQVEAFLTNKRLDDLLESTISKARGRKFKNLRSAYERRDPVLRTLFAQNLEQELARFRQSWNKKNRCLTSEKLKQKASEIIHNPDFTANLRAQCTIRLPKWILSENPREAGHGIAAALRRLDTADFEEEDEISRHEIDRFARLMEHIGTGYLSDEEEYPVKSVHAMIQSWIRHGRTPSPKGENRMPTEDEFRTFCREHIADDIIALSRLPNLDEN